jgi:hypothetical protein
MGHVHPQSIMHPPTREADFIIASPSIASEYGLVKISMLCSLNKLFHLYPHAATMPKITVSMGLIGCLY